jgi:hypothetical protein
MMNEWVESSSRPTFAIRSMAARKFCATRWSIRVLAALFFRPRGATDYPRSRKADTPSSRPRTSELWRARVWNRNGRELFYRSGDRMMAVDVTLQPTFTAGKPRVLFQGPYFASVFPFTGTAYDVSPDGQRFLMVKQNEQAAAAVPLNVVVNRFEELRRRAPTN